MNLVLRSGADVEAIATITSLQNYRSIAQLVAAYIETQELPDYAENVFRVSIHNTLLTDSYITNPTALASKVRSKLNQEDWKGCGAYSQKGFIVLELRRENKLKDKRTTAKASVKKVIKEWLTLDLPQSRKLQISLTDIPPFLSVHPEQLTYQIKRETATQIKIIKLSKSWLIQRK